MTTTPQSLVASGMLILGLQAIGAPALAQWRLVPQQGTSATREDYDHQQAAAQRLLNAEPPRIGATESWSNPNSGAQGTVTLQGTRTIRQMPCRTLRYDMMTRGMPRATETTFTLCRTADGSWRIAS